MQLKTSKLLGSLLVMAASLIVFNSCQKELSGTLPTNPDPLPDLVTRVTTTVYGFVTDENNEAVVGATVKAGSSTVTTDEYGYFAFSNVQLLKNAAVVTVTKSGYFKGIKTYIATQGKSAFFRIKLIPKNTAGSFVASSGGSVSLSGGMQIGFPANAIVNASTNAAYSGTVNVAASWINPTGTDLPSIMPGDLRGIDQDGYLKVLTTYGMIAVEMTGSNGELLQIAAGSKASVTFPIPASISSSAPGSIPLWYFDEQLGLWKQEGTATKTGSNYVGEVSHFSFWNCDVPANYVQFSCTIVNATGQPMPHVMVKISETGNPYRAGYGWTDSTGYTGGAIPANTSLLLEVFSDYNCGTPAYSQNFSSANTNVALGNIAITSNTVTANVSGTITDCNNQPVTNGYVILRINNRYYRYPANNTGAFNFNTMLCNGSAPAELIAEDQTAAQQSTALSFTLNSGNNAVGNLQACGVSTQEYINMTINGVNYNLTAPVDSISQQYNQTTPPGSGNITIAGMGSTNQSYTYFSFDNTSIAVGSAQNLIYFITSNINDSTNFTGTIPVNITEYGPINSGFISGNFTGTFQGAAPPPGGTYNVSLNFRVRRRY